MFSIAALQESDIADMYHEVHKSQAQLEELGWVAHCSWDLFYRHYCAIVVQKKLNIFAIRVDGKYAGSVEVADKIDHYIVGYWLGSDYRGQGVATEAVRSVIKQFKDKPILADTLTTNPKSAKVLERLNFLLERTTKTNNFYRFVNYGVDKV